VTPRATFAEGPLGRCDGCGASTVRVYYFTSFLLQRKCSSCNRDMRTTPPALNKKVVYLDQWVISEQSCARKSGADSTPSGANCMATSRHS
jgi:hypothetical protein